MIPEIRKVMLLTVFFFSLWKYSVYAGNGDIQTANDSLPKGEPKFPYKQYIVPVALMSWGTIEVILAPDKGLLNNIIGDEVIKHQPKKNRIDDITVCVPALSVYALNLLGVKGKHDFKDRTIILGLASLFTGVSVNGIKYTTKIRRPDQSGKNSFPSGHAAFAFMGAEFLWQEYKNVSIWYGVTGYIVAAGTGALRMYNNKHWFGDVAFGAGIGILSTKLAYWIHSSTGKRILGNCKNRKNIAFYPYYNGQQGGFYFSVQL